MVTRMICMDYSKAGGWIPGLIYVSMAILCQIVRVYTDLWLSRWTDQEQDTWTDGEQSMVYISNFLCVLNNSLQRE